MLGVSEQHLSEEKPDCLSSRDSGRPESLVGLEVSLSLLQPVVSTLPGRPFTWAGSLSGKGFKCTVDMVANGLKMLACLSCTLQTWIKKSIMCCRVRFISFDAFEMLDFTKYLERKNIQPKAYRTERLYVVRNRSVSDQLILPFLHLYLVYHAVTCLDSCTSSFDSSPLPSQP